MIKQIDNNYLADNAVRDAWQPGRVQSDRIDTLLRRGAYLLSNDRLLIELSVGREYSHRKIAGLLNAPYGTIGRRLKKLRTLLVDPLIARLLDGPWPLDRTDRALAIAYFLHRRTLRDLAREHGIPAHQISRRLQFVRGWFRGASPVSNGALSRAPSS